MRTIHRSTRRSPAFRLSDVAGLLTLTAATLAGLWFSSCAGLTARNLYIKDSFAASPIRGMRVLYAPLDAIGVEYFDNTRFRPDTQFTESLLVDAANGLTIHELGRVFQVVTVTDSLSGAIDTLGGSRYSRIVNGPDSLAAAGARVRAVAAACGADLVALPYACTIRQRVMKPAGWRDGKYESGSYERPTSHRATCHFHLQLWDSGGDLVYERTNTASVEQPFLYSMLKRKKTDEDIVVLVKKVYAPPIVKALNKAIRESLMTVR